MGLFAKKKDLEKQPEAPDVIVTDLEFLRCVSIPTDLSHIKEINFVERCKKSLGTAWTAGFGLAAVQIGIPIRAAWYAMKINGVTHERLLWNTKIISASFPFEFQKEGCLSIPGLFLPTRRFQHIRILNGDGEDLSFNGLEAVIVQHELDHWDGKLCIDQRFDPDKNPKIGRNDPCPCGSGKKYKKCCFIEPKDGGMKKLITLSLKDKKTEKKPGVKKYLRAVEKVLNKMITPEVLAHYRKGSPVILRTDGSLECIDMGEVFILNPGEEVIQFGGTFYG